MRIGIAAVTVIGALLTGSCDSRARGIRPVIYADPDKARIKMRTAPVVQLMRIEDTTLTGDERMVEKPPGVAGPGTPAVPLHLAKIRAEVLLTVQGQAQLNAEFYSWIWASGQHGGPRLFQPSPGGVHVVFLQNEAGYLHTVGDYPAYDLALKSEWAPAIVMGWNSGRLRGTDAVERLVSLVIRAEFEGLTETQLREDFGDDGPLVNHYWGQGLDDLIRLVGPLFVVQELDDICLHSRYRSARFAACFVTAGKFPGRCAAFGLAKQSVRNGPGHQLLSKRVAACGTGDRLKAEELRDAEVLPFYWAQLGPRHAREALRVFASAMDMEVRRAACEAAAKSENGRDLAECGAVRSRR